jgi:hypothetical protein
MRGIGDTMGRTIPKHQRLAKLRAPYGAMNDVQAAVGRAKRVVESYAKVSKAARAGNVSKAWGQGAKNALAREIEAAAIEVSKAAEFLTSGKPDAPGAGAVEKASVEKFEQDLTDIARTATSEQGLAERIGKRTAEEEVKILLRGK